MTLPKLFCPLLFTIATALLLASICTLGIAGHTKWLLARYFPAGAWYIWRGQADGYKEQQSIQQWITVDYDETTDRLALVRAVLGVVAGVLGICTMRAKKRSAVEDDTQVLFFSVSLLYMLLTRHSES
jgi:hypothetical protein